MVANIEGGQESESRENQLIYPAFLLTRHKNEKFSLE